MNHEFNQRDLVCKVECDKLIMIFAGSSPLGSARCPVFFDLTNKEKVKQLKHFKVGLHQLVLTGSAGNCELGRGSLGHNELLWSKTPGGYRVKAIWDHMYCYASLGRPSLDKLIDYLKNALESG